MKSIALTIVLILCAASVCRAQDRPTTDCRFAHNGFQTAPDQKVQIAEVSTPAAVQLENCGSPKGCSVSPVATGTPIQVYREDGKWTCGYVSAHDGAGPAWIRTGMLHILPYEANPPLRAWVGTWTGGEDHVVIRAGDKPGTLHLAGNAVWNGRSGNAHFGDTKGSAAPVGNHLHFAENGPNSCAIDMTLMSRYILASDNGLCGSLNARFQGIWKRMPAPQKTSAAATR
jgi:hypothetical protein